MTTIYIEQDIAQHPRTQQILARLPKKQEIIYCRHYGELFNLKAQNFRLQKQQPAYIIAQKRGRLVLPVPEGFGMEGHRNYYFSHMLNCLYDCRYCFLQGMYHSANYLIFINYDDFMNEIEQCCQDEREQPACFFSGFDCDSLAMEGVTGFVREFLPFFRANPRAILELRTKSVNIAALLHQQPLANCIVAFSLTPEDIARQVEFKVPSITKRIRAMAQLAQSGWLIGLRFDPLIYADNFQSLYQQLIDDIFKQVQANQIHSINIGSLRFPIKTYQKLVQLYPKNRLLAQPFVRGNKCYSYSKDLEQQMYATVRQCFLQYVDNDKLTLRHS